MLRDDLPDGVCEMSPATASVYQLLRDTELETRRELYEETILGDGTIAEALQQLHQEGYLERERVSDNPRQYRYAVEMRQ